MQVTSLGERTDQGAPKPRPLPANAQAGLSSVVLLVFLSLMVVGATLFAHWPVLSAQAMSFDDEEAIIQNHLVQNPSWNSVGRFFSEVTLSSVVRGYYRPLTLTSLGQVRVPAGRRTGAGTRAAAAADLAGRNRGPARRYLSHWQTTETRCDYTVAVAPDAAPAYNNRGTAYSKRHDYDHAIEDCTKAIELLPGYAEAYHNRGFAYYSLKQYDKAWADIRKCRQLGGTPSPELVKRLTEATGRME